MIRAAKTSIACAAVAALMAMTGCALGKQDAPSLTGPSGFAAGAAPSTVPVAKFSFSPFDPSVNDVVEFDGRASLAASGRTIVQYDWDFGDGSARVVGASAIVTHSYDTAHTFNATLIVVDDVGNAGTTSTAIQVK